MMFNRFGLNLGRMAGRLIAAPSLSRRRQLLDNFNRVLLRSPGWIFNVIGNSNGVERTLHGITLRRIAGRSVGRPQRHLLAGGGN